MLSRQTRRQIVGCSFLLLIAFMVPLGESLRAEPVWSANVESDLVSETASIQAGETFWLGFRFKMDEGWHIYWRNPGDSGLPPTITWDLPDGITAEALHWPYPKTLEVPPLITYGYEGEMVLLVEMKAAPSLSIQPEPLQIRAHVDYLACEINCVPGSADHAIQLPVLPQTAQKNLDIARLFNHARSFLPIQDNNWSVSALVNQKNIQFHLRPQLTKDSLGELLFYPHDSELIDHAAKQVQKKRGESTTLKVKRSKLKEGPVTTVAGIILASNGWSGKGVPQALAVNIPVQASGVGGNTQSIFTILLFAFLGGLILNLMPCVLPVLSLKILGFAERAQKEHHSPWQHGFMFALGVLASFWVLAIFLISLRSAGSAVGWGFQLQSPLFIILLSVLFTGFFINLLGVFEIGASLTRLGLMNEHQTGVTGSFMNGVVATIIATPCTAPFMGTAIGFGLTQSTFVAFMIFTFLGLGMASPYLLLSIFPHAVDWIPKPGHWMVTFKRILAIPLFLTVVWLIWVFYLQMGMVTSIFLLIGLGVLCVGLFFYGKGQRDHAHWKRAKVTMLVSLILSFGIIFVGYQFYGARPHVVSETTADGIPWQPFSEEVLQKALKSGDPVFLDFTAAWCITCQVNEKISLRHEDVVNKFEELNVLALRADWTSKDEKIEKALAGYGRNSIPLYVLYPGGSDTAPLLLPEILTPSIVLNALEKVEESRS